MKGKICTGSIVLAAKKTGLKLLTTVLLAAIPIEHAIAQPVDYTQPVAIPPSSEINQGLTSPDEEYMKSVLGVPGEPDPDCLNPVTNPDLEPFIVEQNVGPFEAKGYQPVIEALQRIFARVQEEKPDLYEQLGISGMLCVRLIENTSSFSNHSWGTAIDINIGGDLNDNGSDVTTTQLGLQELNSYFYNEGFYWGAGFSENIDPPHFEASEQLVAEWTSPLQQDGAIISLRNRGDVEGSRFLDGRTAEGTVVLAPIRGGELTGTRWKIRVISPGVVALETQGNLAGPRWLNGKTAEGTVELVDNPDPYTGTKWEVHKISPGVVALRNLGDIEGRRWLNGKTAEGTVELVDNPDPYTGTKWSVILAPQ